MMKHRYIKDEFNIDQWPCQITKGLLSTHYELHDHDFVELVIVINGHARHIVDGLSYPAAAGDVFILTGNQSHAFEDVHQFLFYNIMLSYEKLNAFRETFNQVKSFNSLFFPQHLNVHEQPQKCRMRIDPQNLKTIDNLLESMNHEYNKNDHESIHLLDVYLQALLLHQSRIYSEMHTDFNDWYSQLSKILIYIEKHLHESFEINQLATRVNVSERQLNRIFNKACHTSPYQYIINRRLEKACKLLHESDLTISEISSLCGFSDSNYFSRLFRKKIKFSPRTFRLEKFNNQRN